MSFLSKVVTFSIGTGGATTTVPITGIGFQPKALIFNWSGRTEGSDIVGRNDIIRGSGIAISASSRRVIASFSEDNVGTSNSCHSRGNYCIGILNSSSAWAGLADLQSMDSDGFTLVIGQQFTTNIKVTALALGGDDFEDAYIGDVTEPVSTGNQDIINPGFTPSAVYGIMAPGVIAPPNVYDDSRYCIGVAAGDSPECALVTGGSNSGLPSTDTVHCCLDGEFMAAINSNFDNIVARCTVTTWLQNGFRLNWTEVTGSAFYKFVYLAIKGGSHAVKSGLTQTNTTTPISFTSLNFKPNGGMVFSACDIESTADTLADKDELSIGAFSGISTQNYQATRDEDAVATSEVGSSIEYDSIYGNIGLDSASVEGVMIVDDIGDDNINFRMTDADPTQMFFFTWLIGSVEKTRDLRGNLKCNFTGGFQ